MPRYAYPGENIIVGTDGNDVIDGTTRTTVSWPAAVTTASRPAKGEDVIFARAGNDEASA